MYIRIIVMMLVFCLGSHSAYGAIESSRTKGKDLVSGIVGKVAFATMSGVQAAAPKKKYKDDELLVKFRPGSSEDHKKELHKKNGTEKLKEFPELRLHHLKLKNKVSVEEAVKRYQEDPEVEYAEPNFLYSIQGEPGDPRFGELWGLRNTGQTGGTSGADIKAVAAWDITTGSSDVVVAIIDTGIDYNHPDLAANLWVNVGIDTINGDSDPFDDNGHGTHVAGTIGAVGSNSVGVAGINWNVRLTACKFLGAGGSGATDGAIQCLQYIKALKDAGANIVATSNSWGGGAYSQALYDAINAQRDILFIAAAGNSGLDTGTFSHYPSSYDLPNVISVAATDHNDDKATFSNYGRKSAHISAPGVKILSTLPSVNEWSISGGYGFLSGTSMATPHVTGLAALLKAQDPGRDWIAIKNLILAGGDMVSNMSGRTITGRRINAHGSLSCFNTPVLSAIHYPATLTLGTAVTLSALSINCGSPSGPVTVTLSGGEVITLHDDGVAPDIAAGDGIFAATWTPVRLMERLRFSSPSGTETFEYPALAVTPAFLPTVTVSTPYRQSLKVGGGYFPYTWSILWGNLPPGITLNHSTGELSGTPSVPGMYYFTVQVTDSFGTKALGELSLKVAYSGMSESWRREGGDKDVAVDPAGNVYTVDYEFGVRKYDSAGNEVWFSDYSLFGTEWSDAIALGKDGDIYAGGSGCANGWVGNSCAHDSYMLVKFDRAGKVVWSRYRPGAGVYDIATDEAGNAYITGKAGSGDLLTLKYDSSGNLIWEATTPAPFYMGWIWDPYITVDRSGNVYLAGYMESTTHPMDVFVVKYDSSGKELWLKTYDDGGKEQARGVAASGDGAVYVVGTSVNSPTALFLKKLDGEGNVVWTRSYAGGYGTEGVGVAVDGESVYITGSFLGSPYADSEWLLVKYDSSGNRSWAITYNPGAGGNGERVAAGPGGDLFFTGLDFRYVGSVVKYDIAPPTTTASPSGGVYDSALTVTLTATEPATFHYTLDGSTPTAGSPVYAGPLTISASSTLKYFGIDSVGHSETAKTETYAIRPHAVVDGTPGSPTNATNASLTVSGTNVVAYKYSIDGGIYTAEIPVATPIAVSGLAEGVHTLAILGKDGAGIWQVVPTTASWTVDITPPTATIGGAPTSNATAIFTVGGSDVVSYRFRTDGGEYSPETPVATKIRVTSLADGMHLVEAVGRDAAGNWQTVPTSLTWTVDGWPVSIPDGAAFGSIVEAYASLPDESIISVREGEISENVAFNRNVTITLRGGYNSATGIADGITTLYGVLDISNGTVSVENLVIMAPL